MDEYLVTKLNVYNNPRVQTRRVQASDISQAISNSGFALNEIISVKLIMGTDVIGGA